MADRDDTAFTPLDRDDCIEPDAPGAGADMERGMDGDIVRRHLTRAWQSWAPSPDLDARVRARLTSSGAATMGAIGLGAASGGARPGPFASLQATGKLGALVGAGLLGAGFLSGYFAHSSPSLRSTPSSEPRPALVSAPAPSVDTGMSPAAVSPAAVSPGLAPSAPATQTDELASEAPPRPALARERSARASSAGAPASSVATPSANEELALLQRAERAVRSDNAALALGLIAELEARHPRSTLLEERSAIELLAHCQAGATDARPRAERFLRQHPQSLYASRIRELCLAVVVEPAGSALTNPARAGHGTEQKEQR